MNKKPGLIWEVKCNTQQEMTIEFAIGTYSDEDIETLDRISMQTAAVMNSLDDEEGQSEICSVKDVLAGNIPYASPSSVRVDANGEVNVGLDFKKKTKVVDYLGSAMLLHDALFSVMIREGSKLIKKYLIKHPIEGRTTIIDFSNTEDSALPVIILSAPH